MEKVSGLTVEGQRGRVIKKTGGFCFLYFWWIGLWGVGCWRVIGLGGVSGFVSFGCWVITNKMDPVGFAM